VDSFSYRNDPAYVTSGLSVVDSRIREAKDHNLVFYAQPFALLWRLKWRGVVGTLDTDLTTMPTLDIWLESQISMPRPVSGSLSIGMLLSV